MDGVERALPSGSRHPREPVRHLKSAFPVPHSNVAVLATLEEDFAHWYVATPRRNRPLGQQTVAPLARCVYLCAVQTFSGQLRSMPSVYDHVVAYEGDRLAGSQRRNLVVLGNFSANLNNTDVPVTDCLREKLQRATPEG